MQKPQWSPNALFLLTLALISLSRTGRAQLVNYEMVAVGDPGNMPDSTGFGAVPYEFLIGKYEVTIAQYAAFLDAVAKDDPNGLYNTAMGTYAPIAGISRNGEPDNYTYSPIGPTGQTTIGASSPGNRPVTYVSWFDAARFANWMSNGQPTGRQGPQTTENGAYDLSSGLVTEAPALNSINPNTGQPPLYRIPLENEWYKAAYYKGAGKDSGYWRNATQSDTPPGNMIGDRPNQANYRPNFIFAVTQSTNVLPSQNYLTEVGAFNRSNSHYGTFDQSGNVFEWNDLDGSPAASRGLRGGRWDGEANLLESSARFAIPLLREWDLHGIRLANPTGDNPVVIPVGPETLNQGQVGYAVLSGDSPVLKSGVASLILNASNTISSSFSITQGTVLAASRDALGTATLNVASGAKFAIAPEMGALNAVQIEKLGTIAGTLDVGVGRFTLGSSSEAVESAKSLLVSGRNSGEWNGTSGITSSTAAADIAKGIVRSVGWKANPDDSVTIAYAAPGDTNLDGEVNVFDLVNVNGSGTYGRGNPSNWSQGDFDYNGVTNIFDMVQTNGAGVYGRGNYLPATPPSVNAVPEPATWLLASTGLASGYYMLRRRGA